MIEGMIKIYAYTILAGTRTLEQIPEAYRADVALKVEELKITDPYYSYIYGNK